jgi:PhnB protein
MKQVREGFQSVVPYVCVRQAPELVTFLTKAFGAEQTYAADNGTHFEVRIGDSMVMIGDVGEGAVSTARLFMYVHDAEACYLSAIEAGATSLMEPSARPWGDDDAVMLGAGVKDPCGNSWFLAGPT